MGTQEEALRIQEETLGTQEALTTVVTQATQTILGASQTVFRLHLVVAPSQPVETRLSLILQV